MNKRPPDNAAMMRRAAIGAGIMAPLLAQRADAQQPPPASPQPVAVAELVLDTMADLKRLATRPRAVLLSGYRAPTDRGGGLFIWLEGDTTAADDALVVQPDTGAPGRYRRLYDGPVLAAWFGVVGDGVANDTEALQRFLYSVSEGKVAIWAGTYAIDEGKLVIEPPPGASSDRGGRLRYYLSPCLLGDVTFIGRGTGTGAFLTVRNPPQHRGGGESMVGGTLGNIAFVDNTKSTLTTRHGLAAQGMVNWTIGSLSGYGLGGSVYSSTVQTVKINGFDNPDPYANSLNRFGSVYALDCNAVAYDGDSLSEDGNRINFIGAYGEPAPGVSPAENGIMRYTGQGTVVDASSSDGTRGWAMKFGGHGTGNRHLNYAAEIGSENGIWVAALEQFEIKGRVLFTVFHGETWPRTMLKIGGVGRGEIHQPERMLRVSGGATLQI